MPAAPKSSRGVETRFVRVAVAVQENRRLERVHAKEKPQCGRGVLHTGAGKAGHRPRSVGRSCSGSGEPRDAVCAGRWSPCSRPPLTRPIRRRWQHFPIPRRRRLGSPWASRPPRRSWRYVAAMASIEVGTAMGKQLGAWAAVKYLQLPQVSPGPILMSPVTK